MSENAEKPRILIVRRDNIGDLICTLPLISAIRQLNPAARIDILVNSYCAPVVLGNPDLDHVYIYTKAKHKESGESALGVYWRRLLLTLKLRFAKYDWLVLANVSCQPRPLRWAKQVGAKRIVGFTEAGCKGAEIITDPIPLVRGQGKHEVEYLMALLQPFGQVAEVSAARIAPDAALLQEAQAKLMFARQTGKPLVGINLSARLPSQQWPAEKFVELINLLKPRYHSVLFWAPGSASNAGHPGDDEKAALVAAAFGKDDVTCMPTQQLGELIAGIACVDLLVTADGGALHIGAACGKPEVVMFGDSDSTQWYPWRVPYKLLHPASRDVRSIEAAEVAAAVDQLISEK